MTFGTKLFSSVSPGFATGCWARLEIILLSQSPVAPLTMPHDRFTAPASSYPFDPTYAPRRASQTIIVKGPDGAPLADTEVVVEQVNHDFLFGNIGFELVDWINDYQYQPAGASDASEYNAPEAQRAYDADLAEKWLSVFNQATLPFYWGRFEPIEGQPRTAELMKAAQWFNERDVIVKGHPLVWHTVQPSWLLDKPLAEVERLQRARIQREVRDFAGEIDMWDAINEVVIMPVFENGDNAITPLAREKGRIEMIRMAFEEARAVNPNVTLILNDFDMSTAYECLLEGVLEAGIQVDKPSDSFHGKHDGFWRFDA